MGAQRSFWCDALSYFGCGDVPEVSNFHETTMNPRSTPGVNQYFDTTPFSEEPLGTFGNASRNYFHGAGIQHYSNLDIIKNFSAGGGREAAAGKCGWKLTTRSTMLTLLRRAATSAASRFGRSTDVIVERRSERRSFAGAVDSAGWEVVFLRLRTSHSSS